LQLVQTSIFWLSVLLSDLKLVGYKFIMKLELFGSNEHNDVRESQALQANFDRS
jgi:hypothetical protein